MSHDSHVVDGFNKDIGLMSPSEALDHFLSLCGDWRDPNPDPVVVNHEGVDVVRDDLIVGTKTRAGDLLMSRIKEDTVVYVQPRVGLAGVSILDAAKRHGKKVILFMPACKRISHHQACCIERGATPIFYRIAAMPNLNKMALQYSIAKGHYFVPLGLRHELATAAIVKVAHSMPFRPKKMYVATSTGVLTRALQIAWPDTEFVSVAVSRNMKEGELGRARVISEPLPFLTPERFPVPFPSVPTYDAKVFKYAVCDKAEGRAMWNVGAEPVLQDESVYDKIDSNRGWGE